MSPNSLDRMVATGFSCLSNSHSHLPEIHSHASAQKHHQGQWICQPLMGSVCRCMKEQYVSCCIHASNLCQCQGCSCFLFLEIGVDSRLKVVGNHLCRQQPSPPTYLPYKETTPSNKCYCSLLRSRWFRFDSYRRTLHAHSIPSPSRWGWEGLWFDGQQYDSTQRMILFPSFWLCY